MSPRLCEQHGSRDDDTATDHGNPLSCRLARRACRGGSGGRDHRGVAGHSVDGHCRFLSFRAGKRQLSTGSTVTDGPGYLPGLPRRRRSRSQTPAPADRQHKQSRRNHGAGGTQPDTSVTALTWRPTGLRRLPALPECVTVTVDRASPSGHAGAGAAPAATPGNAEPTSGPYSSNGHPVTARPGTARTPAFFPAHLPQAYLVCPLVGLLAGSPPAPATRLAPGEDCGPRAGVW